MNEKEEVDLRGIAPKGYISFFIKAEDTEENEAIHAAFKEFCKIEASNNYTIGLSILLRNYQTDYKFEMVANKLLELEQRLDSMDKEKDKKDGGMF